MRVDARELLEGVYGAGVDFCGRYDLVVRASLPFAISLALLAGACSSGGSHPIGAAGTGGGISGGGSCPARAAAAPCSSPPAGFGPAAVAPANAGGAGSAYWVGCELTNCSSQSSCTTCTCVDGDDGGVWQCASNDGFQPDTDAAPALYCALYSGPLDASVIDAGPIEQCTPQYPTCTPPYPESPGWQCCSVSSVGGLSEIHCLPNGSGM